MTQPVILISALGRPGPAGSGGGGGGSGPPYAATYLGYQKFADMSAIPTLTVPQGATFALFRAMVSDMSWLENKGILAPTNGQPLLAGEVLVWAGDLNTIGFIETAPGGVLHVSYYA